MSGGPPARARGGFHCTGARKAAAAGLLLLVLAAAGGCWDRREMDDLAIIDSLGVDLEDEGGFTITISVARPSKIVQPVGGGGVEPGKGDWVISGAGPDLATAVLNLQSMLTRQIWFTHIREVIFGEAAARRGIFNHLDFLQRVLRMRLNTRVLATPGRAADVVRASHGLEPSPADALDRLVRKTAQATLADAPTVARFLLEVDQPGIDPTAAVVIPIMPPGGGGGEGPPVGFRISGNAIFRGDRLAGWLTLGETQALLLAKGRGELANLTLPCPAGGRREGTIAVVVTRSRGSTSVEMTPDGPELILQPRIVAKIFQVACPVPLDEPGMMQQVSEILERKVQADIEAALKRAGGLGADIFGFGLALYRSDPKVFNQLAPRWGEEWPLLPVRIKVSAMVISSGSVTNPARVHHEGE